MEYQDGSAWREDAEYWLKALGVKVLNPYNSPFLFSPQEDSSSQQHLRDMLGIGLEEEVHEHMKKIVRFDLACVDRSDFLIAYIDPEVPTFGSINELVLARNLKKPVFLVVKGGIKKCPLWLCGMFPPRYIYSSIEDVKTVLIGIDCGEIQVDSDRWRLLKPEFR